MKSKWFHLRTKAINLRKQGKSIRQIESSLGIPRSTLSGWLKNIKLTVYQQKILSNKHKIALVKARKIALLWHNQQKINRLKFAENEAEKTLLKIESTTEIVELALAFLYLGEGFKKSPRTGISNTDPLILKFFLQTLLKIFNIKLEKIRFELHLRADQDQQKIKKYWAKELKISPSSFKSVSIDKRTIGKISFKNYKGVCVIDCGNIAIQRKLVYIGRKFCEKTLDTLGG